MNDIRAAYEEKVASVVNKPYYDAILPILNKAYETIKADKKRKRKILEDVIKADIELSKEYEPVEMPDHCFDGLFIPSAALQAEAMMRATSTSKAYDLRDTHRLDKLITDFTKCISANIKNMMDIEPTEPDGYAQLPLGIKDVGVYLSQEIHELCYRQYSGSAIDNNFIQVAQANDSLLRLVGMSWHRVSRGAILSPTGYYKLFEDIRFYDPNEAKYYGSGLIYNGDAFDYQVLRRARYNCLLEEFNTSNNRWSTQNGPIETKSRYRIGLMEGVDVTEGVNVA